MLSPNSGPDIDGVKALDEAISKARPNFVDLTKTANNPHFKSSYAPLEDVLSAVTPALLKQGIGISTAGVIVGERFYFVTTITHFKSGGWRSSYFPVTDPAPQKVGGCETYAQRYNVCGLLGITAGADDDGNTASGIKTKRASSNGKAAPASAGLGAGW